MEARRRAPARRASAGGSGRSRRSCCSRVVVGAFVSTRLVARRPDRHEPAAGRRVRRPPRRVHAGRDPDPRHEPAARRDHDRLRHRRRRDRPVHARRAARRSKRLRSSTIVVPYDWVADEPITRRRHELDRHRDDEGDRRRGRDADGLGARASSATGSIGFLVGVVPVALGLLWLPVAAPRRARAGSPRSWR